MESQLVSNSLLINSYFITRLEKQELNDIIENTHGRKKIKCFEENYTQHQRIPNSGIK